MIFVVAILLMQGSPAQLAGEKLFTPTCGSGYCHGVAGAGGGGPALAGRTFSSEYLLRAIALGIPNSAMRGFRGDYSREQIEQIAEYVLSLGQTEAPEPKYDPVVIAGFEAGHDVFQNYCAVCHAFRGTGGKVGPDLNAAAIADAQKLTSRILASPSKSDSPYQLIIVTTKNNRTITGVRRREDKESMQIFDVSALPPVSRTVEKGDVSGVDQTGRSAMPGDFGKRLTPQQVADLIAFLKQSK
jgi:putative heme-binding domain-containing protein